MANPAPDPPGGDQSAAGRQEPQAEGVFPTPEVLSAWLPQYEVVERTELGTQSAVYRARQPGLDRQVLIRVMPEPAAERVPLLFDRLRKSARLTHPSIVAVFDFGQAAAGPLYLVMEHVDGGPLKTLIPAGAITKTRAYQLALCLCEALQLVHDRGLTHGALSSSTVLVTRDWQVKLTGVGMTELETGELSWLAPLAGTVAGDIQALGGVIHEMFAGSRPDANGRVSRNLPPGFARVLMRCLDSDPVRRYERPGDVRDALMEALRVEKKRAAAVARKPSPVGSAAPERDSAPPPARAPAATPFVPPAIGLAASPRRPVANFIRRLERFLWAAIRAGLHLSILTGTVILLVVMFAMKDRIVIETVESGEPTAETEAERPPVPPPVQQPLGLGPLPPPPILNVPNSPGAPLAVNRLPPDPKAGLDAQYLNAVQFEITTALDASRLNEMPYLKREVERIQSGQPVPDQDEPGLPPRLKQLREVYRSELAKIAERSKSGEMR